MGDSLREQLADLDLEIHGKDPTRHSNVSETTFSFWLIQKLDPAYCSV